MLPWVGAFHLKFWDVEDSDDRVSGPIRDVGALLRDTGFSGALVGIEADPEWMRLVEQGGEFKGSRVFGTEFPSTEHVLLDSETLKIRNQQARYLWRMVDSAEEELPWLGDRVLPSTGSSLSCSASCGLRPP